MNGHGADMPMEVFSAGTVDLDQLVMFVVDATRPFSSPARFVTNSSVYVVTLKGSERR